MISVTMSFPSLAAPKVVTVARDLGTKPAAEEVDTSAYSFEYTGKHDHGDLLPIADNVYGHLVDALKEAKATVDAALKAEVAATGAAAGPKAKVCCGFAWLGCDSPLRLRVQTHVCTAALATGLHACRSQEQTTQATMRKRKMMGRTMSATMHELRSPTMPLVLPVRSNSPTSDEQN